MSPRPDLWHHFVARGAPAVAVTVTRARGSTPRERGAWMAVTADGIIGTIGGGQLEFLAIAHAREILAAGSRGDTMDIPLGPEISQCCGGRVELDFSPIDVALAETLTARVDADYRARPQALVFGAGHVGKALAIALSALPLRTRLIDTRADALAAVGEGVETVHVPLPEMMVREAPAGSAFVVLTHEHGLDFLIAREVLLRGDAAYVGMIGSATKRTMFTRFLREHGDADGLAERLVCPIGERGVRDKRPEIIAALTAAEVVVALADTLSMGQDDD